MNKSITLALIATLGAASTTAFAANDLAPRSGDRSIELRDGNVVVIFADGKMSMRDQRGRVLHMQHGQAMVTKDGQTLAMNGNEVQRKTEAERIYSGA